MNLNFLSPSIYFVQVESEEKLRELIQDQLEMQAENESLQKLFRRN